MPPARSPRRPLPALRLPRAAPCAAAVAWRWAAPLAAGLALAAPAGAVTAPPPSLPAVECTALADDALRLACYDRLHGRRTLPAPAAEAPFPPATLQAQPEGGAPRPPSAEPPSRLDRRWDLTAGSVGPLFAPRPYKPVYVLPATWSDRVNVRPSSPAPERSVTETLPLRDIEAKYQLSLKALLGRELLGSPVNLWGGYTQSSRWQVYNGAISRPFRETNYEPELMLVWPLQQQVLGWRFQAATVSLNHQSNGRSLPLSRSWNRIIGTLAFERDEWVVEFRPWMRLREKANADDNPDIEDHIGRAELLLGRYWGEQALNLQLRHSLRGGARSRGSMQLEWVFPLSGVLHGHLQWFTGYGESMVDYNIRQNRIGLGVTIAGWR